ncbi:MAG: transporter [Acidobacteria bacterium]|nr:transporter [Acidobacteriota bacterium]
MKPLTLLCFCVVLSPSLSAQQRPLVTEPALTVKAGDVLVDIGIEFLQDVHFPFSGLRGDLTRAGAASLRLGVGRKAELQIAGTFQNFLNIERRSVAPNAPNLRFQGDSTSDVGDITVAMKWRLLDEQPERPALGFRFATDLPNAGNESGLGNDETNFHVALLLEKEVRRLRVLANTGLSILGDPDRGGAQDDLFSYGLAVLYPLTSRLNVIADFYGRAGEGSLGTDEQSLLRLGGQIKAVGLFWDVSVLVGFHNSDPSSGVAIGISKQLHFPLLGY